MQQYLRVLKSTRQYKSVEELQSQLGNTGILQSYKSTWQYSYIARLQINSAIQVDCKVINHLGNADILLRWKSTTQYRHIANLKSIHLIQLFCWHVFQLFNLSVLLIHILTMQNRCIAIQQYNSTFKSSNTARSSKLFFQKTWICRIFSKLVCSTNRLPWV